MSNADPETTAKDEALVAIQAAFMAAIKDNPVAALACLSIARAAVKAWTYA